MSKSFDEICKQLVEIGQLTGKLALAQSITHKQQVTIQPKTIRSER